MTFLVTVALMKKGKNVDFLLTYFELDFPLAYFFTDLVGIL